MEDRKSIYEKKITSTSISIVKTPRREDATKVKNEIEFDFCKKYANIQIGDNAIFQDRMQFDIYKRATKDKRMMLIEELSKDKIPRKHEDKLYERLIDDGKNWSRKKKQLETFTVAETERLRDGGKRITKADSDKFYTRMIQQQKLKEEEILKKRTAVQFQKHQAEIKAMQNARYPKCNNIILLCLGQNNNNINFPN